MGRRLGHSYILYLVHYMLISSLQLAKFIRLGQTHQVTEASAKYCAIL